jgi:hypothetical protein
MAATGHKLATLLSLPPELLHEIATFLQPIDLVQLSLTCRTLYAHATDDSLWLPLLQDNLPSATTLTLPPSFPSYRALYAAFAPSWFLPKYKLWIGNYSDCGKLILARFDPRRAVIEAHTVVAERGIHTFSLWSHDSEVIIHAFTPTVQLDLNYPALHLKPNAYRKKDDHGLGDPALYNRLQREVRMDTYYGSVRNGICSTFMLARALQPELINPGTAVWPPTIIPAPERARNDSQSSFKAKGHKPEHLSEVSTGTFRLRKWMQFGTNPISAHAGVTMRSEDDVITFGTISEEAYTPTQSKPWRGIWVGDYSGHGCEFLLVTQPEKGEEGPLPDGVLRPRSQALLSPAYFDTDGVHPVSNVPLVFPQHTNEPDENDQVDLVLTDEAQAESVAGSSTRDAQPEGRLEAIKLTGDLNVPRGEYTFIAPDIGPKGLIRVANEDPFKGARIVKSAGHIAGRGFREDQYIASQLIMISHDRLAQYWEQFGHISFYQRVDVDALIRGQSIPGRRQK